MTVLSQRGTLTFTISLAIFLLIVPILESSSIGQFILRTAISVLYVIGLLVSRESRMRFRIALSLAGVALILSWFATILHSFALLVCSQLAGACYLAFTAYVIFRRVWDLHGGTAEGIYGAIAVYLLVGLTGAMLYRTCELIDPNALKIDETHRRTIPLEETELTVTRFSQLVYFSFVTMSTLGYGDITPRSPLTESLAWVQSVLGQLYLVVLVARLVNVLPSPKRET